MPGSPGPSLGCRGAGAGVWGEMGWGTWWLQKIHTVRSSVPGPECDRRRSVLIQNYNFASSALSILFAGDLTSCLEGTQLVNGRMAHTQISATVGALRGLGARFFPVLHSPSSSLLNQVNKHCYVVRARTGDTQLPESGSAIL